MNAPRDAKNVRVVSAGSHAPGAGAALVAVQTLWRARTVVMALVAREIRGRYVGSTLGAVWSLAHPLLQLVTLTFVFATVLKVRISGVGGTDVPFVLYLACGLFPWLAVQEGVLRGATSLVDNPTLVKRVVFPVETLPVQLALSAVVNQLIATLVLLALATVLGFPPRPSLAAIPLLLLPQLLLTVGFGWAAGGGVGAAGAAGARGADPPPCGGVCGAATGSFTGSGLAGGASATAGAGAGAAGATGASAAGALASAAGAGASAGAGGATSAGSSTGAGRPVTPNALSEDSTNSNV